MRVATSPFNKIGFRSCSNIFFSRDDLMAARTAFRAALTHSDHPGDGKLPTLLEHYGWREWDALRVVLAQRLHMEHTPAASFDLMEQWRTIQKELPVRSADEETSSTARTNYCSFHNGHPLSDAVVAKLVSSKCGERFGGCPFYIAQSQLRWVPGLVPRRGEEGTVVGMAADIDQQRAPVDLLALVSVCLLTHLEGFIDAHPAPATQYHRAVVFDRGSWSVVRSAALNDYLLHFGAHQAMACANGFHFCHLFVSAFDALFSLQLNMVAPLSGPLDVAQHMNADWVRAAAARYRSSDVVNVVGVTLSGNTHLFNLSQMCFPFQ